MKSLGLLLQTLVSFWDVVEEAFLFQGQRIKITLEDVYFLTRLPMLGLVGDLAPMLSQGKTLEELCDRHCYAMAYVCGSYILMCDIEELSTWVVGTLLRHILGSMVLYRIMHLIIVGRGLPTYSNTCIQLTSKVQNRK